MWKVPYVSTGLFNFAIRRKPPEAESSLFYPQSIYNPQSPFITAHYGAGAQRFSTG
ncbi:MAG: hypothetical protein LBC47_05085 [Tannerella sp.]|jgi:hypothetical protein|nr:hypothetical protein [Tannerella sp.]